MREWSKHSTRDLVLRVALPLTSCAIFDKSNNLLVSQVPHLFNRSNTKAYQIRQFTLAELSETISVDGSLCVSTKVINQQILIPPALIVGFCCLS
jgi:hypothetical protein